MLKKQLVAILSTVLILAGAVSIGNADIFRFDTDPFAGSTALITPGRQVVGGEGPPFITFNIASDIFSLESTVFDLAPGTTVLFANNVAGSLPTSGVNIIVLQTFDDDGNAATAFGAGNAANLIAAQITSPGPGFFIYFNSGLDVPRLVYSTDLDDNQADLKILFRMENLIGQGGRDAMSTFTAENFQIPLPSTLLLFGSGLLGLWRARKKFKK
jgi:PEP-CTERM motif